MLFSFIYFMQMHVPMANQWHCKCSHFKWEAKIEAQNWSSAFLPGNMETIAPDSNQAMQNLEHQALYPNDHFKNQARSFWQDHLARNNNRWKWIENKLNHIYLDEEQFEDEQERWILNWITPLEIEIEFTRITPSVRSCSS